MPGRTLLPERSAQLRHYHQPDCVRRRAVLRDTLAAFVQAEAPDHYQRLAAANLARWQARAVAANGPLRVEVQAGDWGEVTGAVTAREVAADGTTILRISVSAADQRGEVKTLGEAVIALPA